MRYIVLALIITMAGCNSPPLYQQRAREYLVDQKVESDLIRRVIEIKPLQRSEVDLLLQYDNIPTLHLLASNPSISENVLRKLAQHPDEEVRWGVAVNPNSPVDILNSYRTIKKYTTMNTYLARNHRLPKHVIIEMYNNREALDTSFALNENCPEQIMLQIAKGTDTTAKAWLAKNPKLTDQVFAILSRSQDPVVQQYLQINPRYKELSSN